LFVARADGKEYQYVQVPDKRLTDVPDPAAFGMKLMNDVMRTFPIRQLGGGQRAGIQAVGP
jgi:hypothetical protein